MKLMKASNNVRINFVMIDVLFMMFFAFLFLATLVVNSYLVRELIFGYGEKFFQYSILVLMLGFLQGWSVYHIFGDFHEVNEEFFKIVSGQTIADYHKTHGNFLD